MQTTPSAPTLRCYSKPGESTEMILTTVPRAVEVGHVNIKIWGCCRIHIEFWRISPKNTAKHSPMISNAPFFWVNPRLMKLRSTDTIGSITLIRTVGSGWARISSLRRWRWDSWDTDLSLQTFQSLYSIQEQVLQLSAHQHNSTELIADASKATSPAHSTQYMVQAYPVRLNLLISNKWLHVPAAETNLWGGEGKRKLDY